MKPLIIITLFIQFALNAQSYVFDDVAQDQGLDFIHVIMIMIWIFIFARAQHFPAGTRILYWPTNYLEMIMVNGLM